VLNVFILTEQPWHRDMNIKLEHSDLCHCARQKEQWLNEQIKHALQETLLILSQPNKPTAIQHWIGKMLLEGQTL
jgi:hypothetical protein